MTASRLRTTTWAIVVSALYCMPYTVLGRDVRVNPHDSLDSMWTTFELSAERGTLSRWGGTISGVLGGLPAAALGSDLSLSRILVEIFGLFPAYVLSAFLARAVAFYGMHRLLQLHLFDRRLSTPVVLAMSAAWAWQPYWSPGGIAVLGLPLLASAYLRMRRGTSAWADFAIVALVPFFGSPIFAGVFALTLAVLDVVMDRLRCRPVGRRVAGIAISVSSTAIVELEGILTFPGASHRATWISRPAQIGTVLDPSALLRLTPDVTYDHVALVGFPLLVGAAIIGSIFGQLDRDRRTDVVTLNGAAPLLLAGAAIGLIVLANASGLSGALRIRELLGEELRTFQWRFDWVAPLPAFLGAALGIDAVSRRGGLRRVAAGAVLAGLLVMTVASAEWAQERHPSWDQFFMSDRLAPAVAEIARCGGSESVIALGIHPSVLQHQGLRTVGGYFQRYPASAKSDLRHLIAGELSDDEVLRRYFDEWGSRAYVLTSELGVPGLMAPALEAPIHLDIDVEVARSRFNAGWVISVARISNAGGLSLREVPLASGASVHLYALGGSCA